VLELSDGGLTVRQAQAQIGGCDELILDSFHVAMRIQNMMQVTKGLEGQHSNQILKDLERVKWHIWHSCPKAAEERLDWLIADIEARYPNGSQSKLLRMAEKIAGYIANNTYAIVNFWQALPQRRHHLLECCRTRDQPGDFQTNGQEAADGMVTRCRP